jgi:O-6-methylguanine DNA methyltransferase
MPAASLTTPVGPVTVIEDGGVITRLDWCGGQDDRSAVLDAALDQIDAYFAGSREGFDLPLAFGSGFQADFLRALTAIPFGQTRTYGDLAKTLGVSAQSVGQACGANRIPILIPCHRVLAQCGLGGYSGKGGIETKVALLRLESAASLLI